jgi:hypothetical protein
VILASYGTLFETDLSLCFFPVLPDLAGRVIK